MDVAVVCFLSRSVAHKELPHVAGNLKLRGDRGVGVPRGIVEPEPCRKLGAGRYALPQRAQARKGRISTTPAAEEPRAAPGEPGEHFYGRGPEVDRPRACLGRWQPPDARGEVYGLPLGGESFTRPAAGQEAEAQRRNSGSILFRVEGGTEPRELLAIESPAAGVLGVP